VYWGKTLSTLLNLRFWVGLALAASLAFSHFASYRAGKAAVRADWNVEKLALSETARLREKALTHANEGVDRALQAEKKRRAAAERVTSDRLRDLQAALAARSDDTAPASGADDPRDAIIGQCAGALAELDRYAQSVASTATALQSYAANVCVSQ